MLKSHQQAIRLFKIYDNGGESFDRYTFLVEPSEHDPQLFDAIGMSDDPDWPLGFSQYCQATDGPHLGHEVTIKELPELVAIHALERLTV